MVAVPSKPGRRPPALSRYQRRAPGISSRTAIGLGQVSAGALRRRPVSRTGPRLDPGILYPPRWPDKRSRLGPLSRREHGPKALTRCPGGFLGTSATARREVLLALAPEEPPDSRGTDYLPRPWSLAPLRRPGSVSADIPDFPARLRWCFHGLDLGRPRPMRRKAHPPPASAAGQNLEVRDYRPHTTRGGRGDHHYVQAVVWRPQAASDRPADAPVSKPLPRRAPELCAITPLPAIGRALPISSLRPRVAGRIEKFTPAAGPVPSGALVLSGHPPLRRAARPPFRSRSPRCRVAMRVFTSPRAARL